MRRTKEEESVRHDNEGEGMQWSWSGVQLLLLYPENLTTSHLKYLFKPHWCIGGEIFIQLRRIDPDCPSPSLPVSVTLHPDWAMKIGKVCPFLYWTKFPQGAESSSNFWSWRRGSSFDIEITQLTVALFCSSYPSSNLSVTFILSRGKEARIDTVYTKQCVENPRLVFWFW
jgi:hypothetical protein